MQYEEYYQNFIKQGYDHDKSSEMALLETQADEDDYVPEEDESNYPSDDYCADVEGGYL